MLLKLRPLPSTALRYVNAGPIATLLSLALGNSVQRQMQAKLTGISLKFSGLKPPLLDILYLALHFNTNADTANCLRFTVALPPIFFPLPAPSESDRIRRCRIATTIRQLTGPNASNFATRSLRQLPCPGRTAQ
jgi:hypothetical protein